MLHVVSEGTSAYRNWSLPNLINNFESLFHSSYTLVVHDPNDYAVEGAGKDDSYVRRCYLVPLAGLLSLCTTPGETDHSTSSVFRCPSSPQSALTFPNIPFLLPKCSSPLLFGGAPAGHIRREAESAVHQRLQRAAVLAARAQVHGGALPEDAAGKGL